MTTSLYLSNNYAPVTEEVTAVDLPVIGQLPADLTGPLPAQRAEPAHRRRRRDPSLVHR